PFQRCFEDKHRANSPLDNRVTQLGAVAYRSDVARGSVRYRRCRAPQARRPILLGEKSRVRGGVPTRLAREMYCQYCECRWGEVLVRRHKECKSGRYQTFKVNRDDLRRKSTSRWKRLPPSSVGNSVESFDAELCD